MEGFSVFGMPPEIAAEMQRQQELHAMSISATRHDIVNLFKALDKDQLITLRLMFQSCEGDYASSMAGYITAHLELLHDICPGCSKVHEEPTVGDFMENTVSAADVAEAMTKDAVKPESAAEEQDRMSLLMGYGVRDHNEQDIQNGLVLSEGERPVICEGCGMLFQSLEDRMLRRPGMDGCQGCQHKSAHG